MKNANAVSRRWCEWIVFVAMATAFLTACDHSKPTSQPLVKTLADYFDVRVGDKVVHMQIAVRENEMTRGLMERTNLGRDEGMLFIYDKPQRMSFWMRNTPTPLDIGFFDAAGVLQEFYPLQPFDETTVSSRGTALKFALEMNQGWFHENSVKPGAQLDLSAVAAALKARGFEPEEFRIGK